MPKKIKMNLTDLDVQSFKTTDLKGGIETGWKCMLQSIGHCTNWYEKCPDPNL